MRGPKLIVMSRGHDFERSSFRRAFSSESWGLTEILAHKIGVFKATSDQYRLREFLISTQAGLVKQTTLHQTSIKVDTITGFSSPIPNIPMTKIDDKSSLGSRRTGDCKRTACSKCDSSSWR